MAIQLQEEISVFNNPVLRYAFGAAIIMLAAMGLNYTLSYLTPVLAIAFLAPGMKAPTLKSTVLFLTIIGVASISGLIFTRLFLPYPLVFIPLLLLIIFLIYYSESHPQVKTWMIIALLVIPMIAMKTPSLGQVVAVNLFVNALLALVLVWLVFFLFPEGKQSQVQQQKKASIKLNEQQRLTLATKQLIVIAPVLILFFVFNWTGAMLILIFVALLSMNPAAANKKFGLALIFANLGGGLAAIFAFNLLTIVPEFIFLGFITLLTALIFGSKLYEGKPISTIFGTAFSTFLLILGNVTQFVGEAGEMVWERIFQLGVVVIYIVLAFFVVNHFHTENPKTETR